MVRKLLEGKVVIIVGASSGIGASIGELFAEEGANVALVARRLPMLKELAARINDKGIGKAIAIQGDVTKEEDTKPVFDKTIEAFGKLDVVVNCAGVGYFRAVDKTPTWEFDALYECNLRGAFFYCREAVNCFLPRREGNIINIGSVNGVRPLSGAAYGAVKYAINGMTKNIALRLTGTGVRINALCPGPVLTPMMDQTGNEDMKGGDKLFKVNGELEVDEDGSMLNIVCTKSNRGVPSTSGEIANAALFLASDLSSALNGDIMVADKGAYL